MDNSNDEKKRVGEAADTLKEKAAEAAKVTGETIHHLGENVKEGATEVAGTVVEITSDIVEKTSGFLEVLKEKAQHALGTATERAEDLTQMDLNKDGKVGDGE